MAFCGNCGSSVRDGKFCPKCGAPVLGRIKAPVSGRKNASVSGTSSVKKKNALKITMIIVAIAVILGLTLKLVPNTANKPCDWCGRSPSVEYKTASGSKAHVCKDCSKQCAWCSKKSTKHYENAFGMIVFVCDNCYKTVSSY